MIELDVKLYAYPNGTVALKNFKEVFYGSEFIIGCTGSGKSTILRMMNGLIPNFYSGVFEGKIRVFGREPNPSDVFYIKQNPEEMVTCLTVIDEIAFPLVQSGMSVAEAKREAMAIAEELEIDHLLHKSVFEISTGELQLVEIASGIALQPRFIVLDEPFAHLSTRNVMRVLDILKDFNCIVADHRIEFQQYFERVVDLGLSIEDIKIPEVDIGDVVYDGVMELRENELVAIIGDNGSGKTTLIKKIAKDMKAKGIDFSIVLQHPPYHLCEDTVEREIGYLAKEFGLECVLNRHPQSLSSGQMKRVAIAKAFRSKILLLDEPTAGQDVNFRKKLVYLLRKHKKSAVIATHDEKLAEMCDRVVEL